MDGVRRSQGRSADQAEEKGKKNKTKEVGQSIDDVRQRVCLFVC